MIYAYFTVAILAAYILGFGTPFMLMAYLDARENEG
jgi:hypothetical protein